MLENKVALVTGGAQGLGEAFAKALAGKGARVVVADLNEAGAETVAASIRDGGGDAIALRCDVSKVSEIEEMARRALAHYGAVDILVNNAGVFDVVSIDDTTEEIWDRGLDINLKGMFFCTKAFAPQMRERRSGKIVNMTSIAGLGGFLNCPAYCASKGGVVNLTRQLGAEWGRKGVRVNAIAPGWFPSEMTQDSMFDDDSGVNFIARNTPMGRPGELAELDGALLFLAGDASSYVTGHILAVDGGWVAR